MPSYVVCGLGLIGRQRLVSLLNLGVSSDEIYLYDPYINLTENPDFEQFSKIKDQRELHTLTPSHLIISVPHDSALKTVMKFKNGVTNILMEKPMGRNLSEATEIWESISSKKLNIGFNYRFMPGIKLLKRNLEKQIYGNINSLRIDIGHGGSPKDNDSWKLNRKRAGGGALLDPGIHILDLLLYLFKCDPGEVELDGANKWSGFWNTGIEESVNLVGRCGNVPFTISISLVAWRTRFRIELIGSDAYSIISGRGRSDGPQVHNFGKRWGWLDSSSQRDSEDVQLLSEKDNSILEETKSWLTDKSDLATSIDGLKSMQLHNSFSKFLGLT